MANLNPDRSGLRPPWKPGESGNPKGRPKRPDMNEALDRVLVNSPDLLDKLVEVGLKQALGGDFRYWQAIYDRLNGKVAASDQSGDTLNNYDDDPEPAPEQLD
jgi:hypothetical protein